MTLVFPILMNDESIDELNDELIRLSYKLLNAVSLTVVVPVLIRVLGACRVCTLQAARQTSSAFQKLSIQADNAEFFNLPHFHPHPFLLCPAFLSSFPVFSFSV